MTRRSSRMSSSRILPAAIKLHRERRVENVGRGEALVNPARGRAHAGRDVFEKRDDVVIRAFLDLVDLRDRKARALPDFRRVRRRNFADLGHRFAGEGFDLEPDLEFPLLGPELAHRRAGITINHRANIESETTAAKRFVRKRNVARADNRRSDAFTLIIGNSLADPSAAEPPVVFHAHLAAAEQDRRRPQRFPWYSWCRS